MKLARVLGYLKSTLEQVLYLCVAEEPSVCAYVDTAYALHSDSKLYLCWMNHCICIIKKHKIAFVRVRWRQS
jgi:hypothetical protein